MNDMSPVIVPKSDQISADDLITGPKTVTIREVKITPGTEQPVSMFLDEVDRAYRPCKSMSRVMVQAWGPDAKEYIGRSLTLYRDPEVKWGGMAVGGIRISHMSHIDGVKQMMLTATKGSRKPHKIMPLEISSPKPAAADPAAKFADAFIAKVETIANLEDLTALETARATKLDELRTKRPDLADFVDSALAAKKAELQAPTKGYDLTPLLANIAGAYSEREVDAIDKDHEADRAFMDEAQVEQLDEALATKRAALREEAAA